MIPEQLERLAPWLDGGLRRFLEGEVWWRAAHGHACSSTGPGHATIGTGLHPRRHGIVDNVWRDRGSGEQVYCVGDPGSAPLTSDGTRPGASRSGANLEVDGFAEYMRAHDPRSKSLGIAGKDRAAILASGRRASWALWWDRAGSGFASSTWYGRRRLGPAARGPDALVSAHRRGAHGAGELGVREPADPSVAGRRRSTGRRRRPCARVNRGGWPAIRGGSGGGPPHATIADVRGPQMGPLLRLSMVDARSVPTRSKEGADRGKEGIRDG